MKLDTDKRELAGALLLMTLGMAAMAGGVRHGPGLLLATLGAGLMLWSLLLIAIPRAQQRPARREAIAPQWRAWSCVIGGVMAFVLLDRHVGLVPATFCLVFIAALGDQRNPPRAAGLLAAGVCTVVTGVFGWLVQIQAPLFVWG